MLLRKSVYQYEYMDEWQKFNETSIHGKKDFYSNLNMEDITDTDWLRAKGVRQEIKNAVEYHTFYLKGDTLLLADVFKNLCIKCV